MPKFTEVAIVGMHFRGSAAVQLAAAMQPGERIRLEREPENQYDAYAIRAMKEDIHVGYVERGQAAWISPLLDEGQVATCIVERLEQRGKNVHPICTIFVEPPTAVSTDAQDDGYSI